jgi:hypothetical protein
MIDEREALERALERLPAEPGIVDRIYRRRRRKDRNQRIGAGLVTVAVVTAVAVVLANAFSSRSVVPTHPRPTPAGGPVLVSPLCEHPSWQRYLLPPYNGKGDCPTTTPAGEYASALLGLHTVWPFIFTLPDGWQVTGNDNGLDLRKRGTDVGVSIIVYPERVANGGYEGAKVLSHWVSQRPYVVSSPVTQITFAGGKAWQVDVRPREGAPLLTDCRVGSRCVPLLWAGLTSDLSSPASAVALLPHTTARLIFSDRAGTRGASPALVVWIWNTSSDGSGPAAEVEQVVESVHFDQGCDVAAPPC